jgi:hypothetical protein
MPLNGKERQPPKTTIPYEFLNPKVQLRVLTESPSYYASRIFMSSSCAAVYRPFSDRAQSGVDVLGSRDKGANSEGQWEAIYCYGYAALGVATVVNSSASTIMLIMDGGGTFLILRTVRIWLFSFLKLERIDTTTRGERLGLVKLVPCCGWASA